MPQPVARAQDLLVGYGGVPVCAPVTFTLHPGRALALVHGRPAEPWTVERLGRLVGLSRSSLAERFSEVMGEPIFAYLTRWRLQLAAESLLSSTRSVEAVAKEAGYESASAFSHAFKRAFGKPPTAWRRRRRRRA